MSWSLRIARIAGIDLKVHWTFFLLLLWFGASYAMADAGVAGAAYGIAFLLSVFACIILHELGHALAARQCGIATRDITLLPIGGVARLERMPSDPKQELWVAIAGPLVNVAIAAILFGAIVMIGGLERIFPNELLRATTGSLLVSLLWTNIVLVVFNMIPAFPMDGGRVLRALLAATTGDRLRATATAAAVGQAIAIVFGILGLFGNPMLLFIALFVYLGAEAEARAERTSAVLADVPVRAAMLSKFKTLHPLDTLGHARDELLAGSQQDFPVESSDGPWGVLHRDDLISALRNFGPDVPVSEVMRIVPHTLTPQDPVEQAIQLMRDSHLSAIPVLYDDMLVGLLTTENLGELLMLREAAKGFAANEAETRSLRDAIDNSRTHA